MSGWPTELHSRQKIEFLQARAAFQAAHTHNPGGYAGRHWGPWQSSVLPWGPGSFLRGRRWASKIWLRPSAGTLIRASSLVMRFSLTISTAILKSAKAVRFADFKITMDQGEPHHQGQALIGSPCGRSQPDLEAHLRPRRRSEWREGRMIAKERNAGPVRRDYEYMCGLERCLLLAKLILTNTIRSAEHTKFWFYRVSKDSRCINTVIRWYWTIIQRIHQEAPNLQILEKFNTPLLPLLSASSADDKTGMLKNIHH